MSDLNEKARLSLGLNMPSANDLIRREDFKSDVEYKRALVDMAAKLNDPEVRRALRNDASEQAEQDEREARKQQEEEHARIRRSVTIDDMDRRNIDKEATRLAHADVAAGRISPSELGARIVEHAEKLTSKRKEEKASAEQLNAMIRAQWRA